MAEGPIRTCCSCGIKRPKRQLQRLVWREGAVQIDPEQNMTGRGAYCCPGEQCLQQFLGRKKKWKRVFRL